MPNDPSPGTPTDRPLNRATMEEMTLSRPALYDDEAERLLPTLEPDDLMRWLAIARHHERPGPATPTCSAETAYRTMGGR